MCTVWFNTYLKKPFASNLVKGQSAAVVKMASGRDIRGPELENAPAAALFWSAVLDFALPTVTVVRKWWIKL